MQGSDYALPYHNNVNVGTATLVVIGKGNFVGSRQVTFVIASMSVARLTLDFLGQFGKCERFMGIPVMVAS